MSAVVGGGEMGEKLELEPGDNSHATPRTKCWEVFSSTPRAAAYTQIPEKNETFLGCIRQLCILFKFLIFIVEIFLNFHRESFPPSTNEHFVM